MAYTRKIALVAYDIADDHRRERVSMLLSGFGPRVQLSVFEAMLTRATDEEELRRGIRELIDPEEDQVRIYRLDVDVADQATIIGAREVEERRDWFIVW
jgi:CRISPR-associated protein Cas2